MICRIMDAVLVSGCCRRTAQPGRSLCREPVAVAVEYLRACSLLLPWHCHVCTLTACSLATEYRLRETHRLFKEQAGHKLWRISGGCCSTQLVLLGSGSARGQFGLHSRQFTACTTCRLTHNNNLAKLHNSKTSLNNEIETLLRAFGRVRDQ